MIYRFSTSLFGAALFMMIFEVNAGTPPPGGWGPREGLLVGSSVGWVSGGELECAFAPGLDITYAVKVNTPLFWWISGGARIWTHSDSFGVLPYAETGFSFIFLSLGAGYAAGLGEGIPRHSVHGFAGFVIPFWAPARGHLMYLEPYWRPTWGVACCNSPVSHELGVLLKWFFMLSP